MKDLPNIKHRKTNTNPTIDADTSDFEIPFYKDAEYFANIDNFIRFIKACERMARTSKYYSRYVKYIKQDVGLRACQVLSNIEEEEDDSTGLIEMHHGPILTLFDYASIITDYLLFHNKKVNTFIVADILMEEHYNNNVQVVMCSETVHEQIHLNTIFINLKQGWGNINNFLEKYYDGINADQIRKINNYIKSSIKFNSTDNDTLKLTGVVKKWSKENL